MRKGEQKISKKNKITLLLGLDYNVQRPKKQTLTFQINLKNKTLPYNLALIPYGAKSFFFCALVLRTKKSFFLLLDVCRRAKKKQDGIE